MDVNVILPPDRLSTFAKSDFAHDFGENVDTRDKFVAADEVRFKAILQRYSTDKQVKNITIFKNEYVGRNLFQLFGPPNNPIVRSIFPGFPTEQGDAGYMKEDAVLNDIGLKYEALKRAINDKIKSDNNRVFELPDQTYAGHTYTVRASKYKNSDGSTKNLSTIFSKVTGDKTKFVLEIDATGGLSTSSILNNTLLPSPQQQCDFYILNNIENDSDSATKLTNFEKGVQGGAPQPNVYFLRDKESTVVYPVWGAAGDPPSTNLYTGGQVVLNRVNDEEIEANIAFGKESYSFGDVANTSNVKNASLNAVASKLVKPNSREQYIFPLLKRMGDWCQALSLLDRTRVYEVEKLDPVTNRKERRDPPATTTLEQLSAEECEIGIVTNDRILLAFSLALGLNVFFTTQFDVACLVYFKNNDDTPSEDAIQSRLNGLIQARDNLANEFSDEYVQAQQTACLTRIDQLRSELIQDNPDLQVYLLRVKAFFATLGQLRLGYQKQLNALNESGPSDGDSLRIQLAKVNTQIAILTKLNQDIAYDHGTIQKLSGIDYPNSSTDSNSIASLLNLMSRGFDVKKTEAFLNVEKMILSIRDDIKQIEQKEELQGGLGLFASIVVPPDRFPAQGTTGRQQGKFRENLQLLWNTFDVVFPPQQQQGGGHGDLESVWNAIRVLEIPMEQRNTPLVVYDDNGNMIDRINKGPVSVAYRSYYTDEKSHEYSVFDKHIVTKDNLDDFKRFFNDINSVDPTLGRPRTLTDLTAENQEKTKYVCTRFLLLYHDLLRERLQKLKEETPEEPEPDYLIKVERVLAEVHNFDGTMRQSTDILNTATLLYEQMTAADGNNDAVFNVYNQYYRGQDPFTIITSSLERIRNELASFFPKAPKVIPIAELQPGSRNLKTANTSLSKLQQGIPLNKTYRARKRRGRFSTFRNPI